MIVRLLLTACCLWFPAGILAAPLIDPLETALPRFKVPTGLGADLFAAAPPCSTTAATATGSRTDFSFRTAERLEELTFRMRLGNMAPVLHLDMLEAARRRPEHLFKDLLRQGEQALDLADLPAPHRVAFRETDDPIRIHSPGEEKSSSTRRASSSANRGCRPCRMVRRIVWSCATCVISWRSWQSSRNGPVWRPDLLRRAGEMAPGVLNIDAPPSLRLTLRPCSAT